MKTLFKKVGWLLLATALVALFYCAKYARLMFSGIERLLELACVKSKLFDVPDKPTFEATFSDSEIESMAKKVCDSNLTLVELQKELGISYRQARKVQSAIEKVNNSVHIRNVYA